jgi:hypothetical protein
VRINPSAWTPKTFLWVAIFLLALNLLGPRGLIHFMVIHQEAERLSTELERTYEEKTKATAAIDDFKSSTHYRESVIRERLGYLRRDELLLKFVGTKEEE